MNTVTRILIVEDLLNDYDLAQREIRKAVQGCEFQRVQNERDFLQALQDFQPDLILSDYRLPAFDGLKAMELAQQRTQLVPIIIWTGTMSEDVAVSSMKKGASNYIFKDNLKRLGPAVVHALEERKLLMERKQAEEKYQSIFENSMEGIFQATPDGRFINVNPAMAAIYGYDSPKEMMESVTDIIGQLYRDNEAGRKFLRFLRTHDTVKNFEWKSYRKDGSQIWIATSGRVVRDQHGNMLYYEGFLRDVTERKLLETLMQKRIELMDYAVHHSLDDVLQKTINEMTFLTESHIGFMHFVEADEESLRLQTWSAETLRDFCRAEGAGMHYPVKQAGVWADAIRQRQPLIHNDYESVPDKKGMPVGHPQIVREMLIPIIRNEKIVAVMGVGNKAQEYTEHDLKLAKRFADYAWDTTERKRMESTLAAERNQLAKRVEERTADLSRANSNLARALLVKDEFLASMSHELRTPLNAILGLSESLAEQAAGPLNEKQQRYLTTINESGHHLLSLINDILDLAKIEAGQITLDINKVDISSVCRASLRMIKQLAQKKDQEVILEIDGNLGVIRADERRLKQMLVNLLSNAVKFTPETGKIGLEVRGDRAENRVIFTVWDNGIGISESDRRRLFRPFVQLDSGLAREATGTGLGLALVVQMARLHGGGVSLISHPGEGSRFSIHLPWGAVVTDTSPIPDPHGKKRTVLLIEDTREVIIALTDALERAGFDIITAQDGIDGLTQAQLMRPDFIIMDLQVPRLGGFEVTQKLKSDPDLKNTPIIALTALAIPDDRQRCIDAGMDDYMSKPVNLKRLVKTLNTFYLTDKGTTSG